MERITVNEIGMYRLALERFATGAHAHTANKSRMYLGELVRQGLVDKPLAPKTARFVQSVRSALSTESWKELEDSMRGWF